jgi:LPXTG-site transpeptidase (sortase) family protein
LRSHRAENFRGALLTLAIIDQLWYNLEVERKGSTILAKILGVVSDLLFTCAVILGLYIVWQLYFTGYIASLDQEDAIKKVQWDQPENPNTPAVKLSGDPECMPEPEAEKAMIGRVYVPKFDKNYSRNLVQGTNKVRVLDLQGFGHYEKTAMPGCVGNFAAAAHRDGYGEPLGQVEELAPGDSIIIRTQKYWYVYKITGHQIVEPENGTVLYPVPGKPTEKAIERLLSFTTCHPRWSMDKRYILQAKFDYWAEVKSGVPEEMLAVGTVIKY